jgi:hypothetical protein
MSASAATQQRETTQEYIARTAPAKLLAAYQRAATEQERERRAMALYHHYAARSTPATGYDDWYEANMAAIAWHGLAGEHRANSVAQRVPNPYDRPLTVPKDAALRYLWCHRHWNLEQVCGSGGGTSRRAGVLGGGYWVEQFGATIHVKQFKGQPCAERFSVRALWHELFDGAPVQLSLFG